MNPPTSALGPALIEELVARGWSPEDFGQRTGLDPDGVACVLAGQFGALSPDVARSIARALGVAPRFIERLGLAREPVPDTRAREACDDSDWKTALDALLSAFGPVEWSPSLAMDVAERANATLEKARSGIRFDAVGAEYGIRVILRPGCDLPAGYPVRFPKDGSRE